MQKPVFLLLGGLLATGLLATPPEQPLSVWKMPLVWQRHSLLRQQLIGALRRGDIQAMESICRSALEFMPGDATWHYNLACALAYREQPGLALTELEKAVQFGFRDADAISKDQDLAQISKEPRFAEIVEKARQLKGKPVAGVPVPEPAYAATGSTVTLTATNVVWNFDIGCFQALLKLAPAQQTISSLAPKFGISQPESRERTLVAAWLSEGTAAGNAGDLYFNRDDGHSLLKVSDFPLLTLVKFAEEGKAVECEHPNTLFPGQAVFGNSSRGCVSGPFWRSLGRLSMTEPGLAARMDLLYRNNQFWVFPAVKDFGDPAIGDTFPGAAPFQLVTKGISWSDQPYLRAALAASAAFPIPTKQALLRRHLMGQTLQWLFRRTKPGVRTETDYLSPKAHPTAFAPDDLDPVALVTKAHALRPDQIPPSVALSVVNSRMFPVRYPQPGVDYPDSVLEILYNTSSAIAFVLRAPEARRTFLFQAKTAPEQDPQATFTWAVVHGDAARVTIKAPIGETLNTPERGFAQIEIDRNGLTNRIDVACFAKTAGTEYGAPSIISFYPIPQEKRVYRADGQIESIDYSNPDRLYTDPLVALPRRWKDVYRYSADGTCLGYDRTFNGKTAASFTPTQERILERDAAGRPTKVVPVRYVTRQTGNSLQSMELSYVDEGEPVAK
ncbi:MAG: tetratricopeptide repeat protein [Kiritimatiellia bacterium]